MKVIYEKGVDHFRSLLDNQYDYPRVCLKGLNSQSLEFMLILDTPDKHWG